MIERFKGWKVEAWEPSRPACHRQGPVGMKWRECLIYYGKTMNLENNISMDTVTSAFLKYNLGDIKGDPEQIK